MIVLVVPCLQGRALRVPVIPVGPQWQLWWLEGSGHWRRRTGRTEPAQDRVQGGDYGEAGYLLGCTGVWWTDERSCVCVGRVFVRSVLGWDG
jgi:hypothetical protein